MSDEPKPCPHCGKEANFRLAYGCGMVSCSDSDCTIGIVVHHDPYGEEALEKWNKRKSFEEVRLREKLKDAIHYLEVGKKQFAPGTTNSDVDVFLAENKEFSNV